MKTLLIKPNGKKSQYRTVKDISAIEPPLWMAVMANNYKDPLILDCESLDYSVDDLHIVLDYYAQIHKIGEIVIMAIGSHPSANIQQKAEAIKMKEALSDLEVPITIHDTLPCNPIDIKLPRWDLVYTDHRYRPHNWHVWGEKDKKTYGVIYSSISCPYSCDFCQVKSFYKSDYRVRPIDNVIADIDTQYSRYDIRNFKMMDELFAIPSRHTQELCQALATTVGKDVNIWAYARINTVTDKLLKQMRKGGVKWLAYGIESGNQEIRKSANKGEFSNEKIKDVVKMTKDNGINVVGNYMFGFANDTIDTLKETYDFAVELNCEYSNFYCVVAYPDSPLYNEMKLKGIYLPEDYEEYAQMSPKFSPLPTRTLTSEQVLDFRDSAFTRYFTNSDYLNYMSSRFGEECKNEIKKVTSIKIIRQNKCMS